MKRTVIFIVVLLGCASIAIVFKHNHAKTDTYWQVVNRQGYTLKMMQDPVPVQLSLQPELLNEMGTWNVKLLEKNNTSFILERTETSNGGITITILVQPDMQRSTGTFLSNKVFEEGGSFHYYAQSPLWKIYGGNGRQLDMDVIATGQGDRQFSFTLSENEVGEVAESSTQGLIVQYDGIVSYEYARV